MSEQKQKSANQSQAGRRTSERGNRRRGSQFAQQSEQDRQEAEHSSKTGDEDRARNGALFQLQGLRLPASEGLERRILGVPAAFEEGLKQNAVMAFKMLLCYHLDPYQSSTEWKSEGLSFDGS